MRAEDLGGAHHRGSGFGGRRVGDAAASQQVWGEPLAGKMIRFRRQNSQATHIEQAPLLIPLREPYYSFCVSFWIRVSSGALCGSSTELFRNRFHALLQRFHEHLVGVACRGSQSVTNTITKLRGRKLRPCRCSIKLLSIMFIDCTIIV